MSTPNVTKQPEAPSAVRSSDLFSISIEHLKILRHSIGYDDAGNDRFQSARSDDERRNHFVTSPKHKDGILCQELCAAGYMHDHGPATWLGGDSLYTVTDAGKDAVRQEKPTPPKMTRARRRYQQFLDADCGRPFREWLGIKRKRC